MNFIFSGRFRGGGRRGIVGIISMAVSSTTVFVSLTGSGSTDPRTLESWAPKSQEKSPEDSGSLSTLVSTFCVVCCSAMCSVFCLFSVVCSSPGSGDLERFAGVESKAKGGSDVAAGAGEVIVGTDEVGITTAAGVEDAPVPFVEAGVADAGSSAEVAASDGFPGSVLT